MEPASYSVWLIPPPPVRDRFARLIRALSRRLGTPSFDPHITLAGAPDLQENAAIARARALAEELSPVPVQLTQVGYTDQYFRCLYVEAERSAELLAAYRITCDYLGRPPAADFMPHLSLVYGKLAPEQKQRIIEEIGPRFDTAFVADNISLCLPAGPPAGWRTRGPFALTG